MVPNPRETPGTSPLRPLNAPVPVKVEEDKTRRPTILTLRGRKLKVSSVDDLWEIDDEWWREVPIARMYCQVTTEDGRHITLFRDLAGGGWYWQRAAHGSAGSP